MDKQKYYITTAIAYTSGRVHIGNTYEVILADALARFKRMEGYDVFFQTGTDEHGQKIEDKAKEANVEPQAYVDEVANKIKANFDLMNVSYDKFMRTTDPYHVKQVQKIFKKLYDQGDIYKGSYEGLYCKPCESFWTESQLKDGCCPDCGGKVEKASEEAYFLKLSNYSDRLLKYYDEHLDFIMPESRKNEMINNFIKPGLQDLCVSRTSFTWGIPVDFDEKHVVYVWLDALTNYITSLGYDVDGDNGAMFKKYWPADLQVIGKDIVRFHIIYWPIILMALGLELPKHLFGHPWMLVGEGKMSKSKGNAIYAEDLVEMFGVDAVRYFCLREIPYANDGVITYDLVAERNNSDLANVLGNLVNRTISMANKYFDGIVTNRGIKADIDDELIEMALNCKMEVAKFMDEYKVSNALESIFKVLKRCNKYIDETTPWVLAKDEAQKDRLETVLYNMLEVIRICAVLLQAFIPDTSEKILNELNTKKRDLDSLETFGAYESNKLVAKPEILFERIDIEEKQEEVKNEHLPTIEFDDFMKAEIMVGEIIECKKHSKADKLLVSKVDLGNNEVRQIVSGIAEWYLPNKLVGKKVLVASNIKATKLRGEISEGMILCAESEDGPILVEVNDLPTGSVLR